MKYEEIELIDNATESHLELFVEENAAFIEYKRAGQNLFLLHTEVPAALEGKGVGSALVEKAFRFAEDNDLKIVPLCSFVQVYLQRHSDWKKVIAKDAGRYMQSDEDDE